MIRRLVITAACLAVMASLGGARALPEEPLGSLPLIYDAKDKLVGPLFLRQTYIEIDGRYYILPIQKNNFEGVDALFYYKDENCKTDPYIEGEKLQFTPNIISYKGRLFFPFRKAEFVESKSRRYVNYYGTSDDCYVSTLSGPMLPLKEKSEKYLGITFPIRLERQK